MEPTGTVFGAASLVCRINGGECRMDEDINYRCANNGTAALFRLVDETARIAWRFFEEIGELPTNQTRLFGSVPILLGLFIVNVIGILFKFIVIYGNYVIV